MLKQTGRVEKKTFEGIIAGANVTLSYEQETGQQPITVNASATLPDSGGHVGLNFQHQGNYLTISSQGVDVANAPTELILGLIEEVKELYAE